MEAVARDRNHIPVGGIQQLPVTFSPDGSMVAFVTENRREGKILSTGDFTELATVYVPDDDMVGSFAFSPDGSRIAMCLKQGRAYDLVTMTPDGGDIQIIAESILSYSGLAWSRSGDEILFAGSVNNSQEIFKINLVTGVENQLTKNNVFDAAPTW